jgi:hypothetical protein
MDLAIKTCGCNKLARYCSSAEFCLIRDFLKGVYMTAIIKFLSSLKIDVDVYPRRPYVKPRRGDSRHDFSQITSSMRKVGSDLRKTADKELQAYGK